MERPRPSKRPRPAHLSIRGRKRGRGAVRAPPMHGFMQIKQGRTTPHCPTGNGKERRRRRRPVVAAVALVSAAASSSRLASRGGKHGNGDGRRLSGSCPCRGQASRRRRGAGKSVRADRSLAGCLAAWLLLHLPKFSCNNYCARRVESTWPCVRRSIDRSVPGRHPRPSIRPRLGSGRLTSSLLCLLARSPWLPSY